MADLLHCRDTGEPQVEWTEGKGVPLCAGSLPRSLRCLHCKSNNTSITTHPAPLACALAEWR